MVAKVVRDDGTIPPRAEARAIRWSVRQGARVINLSLGSTRDPSDPSIDGYSSVEQSAIQYAVRHGALVVAAAGNGNDAPQKPWPYASYPAAFPHVLGVGAYGRPGGVPSFSNRDDRFVDLAAPGMDIFSLFPRPLTAPSGPAPSRATRAAARRTTATPTAPRSRRRRWRPPRHCCSARRPRCGPTR